MSARLKNQALTLPDNLKEVASYPYSYGNTVIPLAMGFRYITYQGVEYDLSVSANVTLLNAKLYENGVKFVDNKGKQVTKYVQY